MKIKALLTFLAVGLVGCQTTSVHELQTNASAETIEKVQEILSPYKQFNVTDNGVIEYQEVVPNGYEWSHVHIKEISYRVACEDLIDFLNQGMMVRMSFKGRGGMINDYDQARCDAEESPTKLYK